MHSQLTTDVCIGIDVACAVGKRLPICFVSGLNPLTPLKIPKPLANLIPRGVGNREVSKKAPFAEAAKSVVDAISHIAAEMRWSIKCIAIDAPAAPPNHCPRVSECELASKGLSVFQTPARDAWLTICENGIAHLLSNKSAVTLPCANKIWMLYGFELFTGLRVRFEVEVIEVYPYSIIRALISECGHKSTAAGYDTQLSAVATRTGWPSAAELETRLHSVVPGSRHDRLDAFMAAWVASLPKEKRRAYGNPQDQDDAIWVPL